MRALALFALAAPLLACSSTIRRPVWTTDAATFPEQVTRSAMNEFDPAVSPDGKAIAYDVAATPDATPHVEVMALESAKIAYSSKDTMGVAPTWMPDGSGLIFVSKTHGSARGLVQTFGQGPLRVNFVADAGDADLRADAPAMSPDGKTVAMSILNVDLFQRGWRMTRHFDRALGMSDLIGTGVTIVGQGADPAFSPDGTHIVFARASQGHAHLFLANADGSDPHQITEGSSDDVEPAWSPDGKAIVFCSAHGDDRWTQANLFVVRTDGSSLVQLTEGDRFICHPTWAKDGAIYFHANVDEHFHIWRLRPQGTYASL
jgi:Tol biopolymer transport system component